MNAKTIEKRVAEQRAKTAIISEWQKRPEDDRTPNDVLQFTREIRELVDEFRGVEDPGIRYRYVKSVVKPYCR